MSISSPSLSTGEIKKKLEPFLKKVFGVALPIVINLVPNFLYSTPSLASNQPNPNQTTSFKELTNTAPQLSPSLSSQQNLIAINIPQNSLDTTAQNFSNYVDRNLKSLNTDVNEADTFMRGVNSEFTSSIISIKRDIDNTNGCTHNKLCIDTAKLTSDNLKQIYAVRLLFTQYNTAREAFLRAKYTQLRTEGGIADNSAVGIIAVVKKDLLLVEKIALALLKSDSNEVIQQINQSRIASIDRWSQNVSVQISLAYSKNDAYGLGSILQNLNQLNYDDFCGASISPSLKTILRYLPTELQNEVLQNPNIQRLLLQRFKNEISIKVQVVVNKIKQLKGNTHTPLRVQFR
jgi:hypothetical protein